MKLWLRFFTLVSIITLSACGGTTETKTPQVEETELIELTVLELAAFDGKDGRDAYIAVAGFIYDVSDSSYWRNGIHQGRVEAGKDLTLMIDTESPHGRSVLNQVPRIGRLVEPNE
jgi:predicted heme/steroid binding protein